MSVGDEVQDAGPKTFRSRWVWWDEIPFATFSAPVPLADFVPLFFMLGAAGSLMGAVGLIVSAPASFWTWAFAAFALGFAICAARLLRGRLEWRLSIGRERLTGNVTEWGMFGPVPPVVPIDVALGDIRTIARRTHHSRLLYTPNTTWETFSIHMADGAHAVIGGESEVSDGEPALEALRELAARTGLPVTVCDRAHNTNPWWPSRDAWPPWTVAGVSVGKAQT